MRVRSLGQEDTLQEDMATHSSILAWKIPWTEEPDGLQSTQSKESDTTKHTHTYSLMPSLYRLSGSPRGQRVRSPKHLFSVVLAFASNFSVVALVSL